MEASILLTEIKAHGLDMQTLEGNLHISPRDQITDAIRDTIRQHKADLVDFLESYEERAAIMEYGAGLSREQAEILSFHDLTQGENYAI